MGRERREMKEQERGRESGGQCECMCKREDILVIKVSRGRDRGRQQNA